MALLLAISRFIDGISRRVGVFATWLVLIAACVSAFNALFRYSISTLIYLDNQVKIFGDSFAWILDLYRDNSNTLSDIQLAMFAGMVMLGAPWTLKMNEHVRVDLIYGSMSSRKKAWLDLFGGLFFLVPMCVLMIAITWPWFLEAYTNNELSQNAGGLPRWPAKLCLPLGFGLVLLQGVSELIKCVATLTTDYKREHTYEKPVQ
jgi:TRAP-type mannitol/chloroaromatic compound transport system permease small subunit